MPLFENKYQAQAKTELERRMRELEETAKKAVAKEQFDTMSANLTSNINFSEQIQLITAKQAEDLRMRQTQASVNYEKMMRSEFGDRVDDMENPRERAHRYFSLDSANSAIQRERRTDAEKAQAQSQPSTTKSVPVAEEEHHH